MALLARYLCFTKFSLANYVFDCLAKGEIIYYVKNMILRLLREKYNETCHLIFNKHPKDLQFFKKNHQTKGVTSIKSKSSVNETEYLNTCEYGLNYVKMVHTMAARCNFALASSINIQLS